MANHSQPPPTGGTSVDIHTPFTRTERIEQLADIDKDIASLLLHLSQAMRALATPPNSFVPPLETSSAQDSSFASEEPQDPQTAFQTAQTNFFNTIDRVGKHLDRNIFALEEAGIISLRSSSSGQQQQDPNNLGGGGGPQQSQSVPGSQGQGGGSFNAGGGAVSGARVDSSGIARLEPDGAGRYGRLDVGKLNMASSTLERDKEAELWRKAREFLEKVEQRRGDRMQE
ncbi:hypothetical protein QBC43DRAFT_327779 [Cladorrhinum sp. PSN259]|nr:hypothetical protein QBC43DRAFT_327779 [Cladorrhinum sp. PSN259]